MIIRNIHFVYVHGTLNVPDIVLAQKLSRVRHSYYLVFERGNVHLITKNVFTEPSV